MPLELGAPGSATEKYLGIGLVVLIAILAAPKYINNTIIVSAFVLGLLFGIVIGASIGHAARSARIAIDSSLYDTPQSGQELTTPRASRSFRRRRLFDEDNQE